MRSALLQPKFLVVLLAIFTALSFFAVVFHHHSDAHHTNDCPVCRLVEYVSALLITVVIVLLSAGLKVFCLWIPFKETFVSLLLASNLKDRAPPVLPVF